MVKAVVHFINKRHLKVARDRHCSRLKRELHVQLSKNSITFTENEADCLIILRIAIQRPKHGLLLFMEQEEARPFGLNKLESLKVSLMYFY